MGESHDYKQLSREELEKLAGEQLPERAAMSLINANVAAPINAAVALNVASDLRRLRECGADGRHRPEQLAEGRSTHGREPGVPQAHP